MDKKPLGGGPRRPPTVRSTASFATTASATPSRTPSTFQVSTTPTNPTIQASTNASDATISISPFTTIEEPSSTPTYSTNNLTYNAAYKHTSTGYHLDLIVS